MDKHALVAQLIDRLQASASTALRASEAAAAEAKDGATPQEKREDARVAIEQGRLAKGQSMRAQRALAELDLLTSFRPGALPPNATVALGALVEVEDEDTGEGKTFFLAPSGAGLSLTGPGGDGHLSVVTPQSPVGRAVLGRKVGATIEVTVDGEIRAWTIAWVG